MDKDDSLRYPMTFGGKADVSPLQGAALSLRFNLTRAELVSFAFRP